jgi:hypothetical protein
MRTGRDGLADNVTASQRTVPYLNFGFCGI